MGLQRHFHTHFYGTRQVAFARKKPEAGRHGNFLKSSDLPCFHDALIIRVS